MENKILCGYFRQESAPVRSGVSHTLLGPIHTLYLIVQYNNESFLHCGRSRNMLPNLQEIQGHLWQNPRYVSNWIPTFASSNSSPCPQPRLRTPRSIFTRIKYNSFLIIWSFIHILLNKSRFSGRSRSISNRLPFCHSCLWWVKQARPSQSPVIICSHWAPTVVFTSSIGSTDTTLRGSLTLLRL